MKKYDYSKLLGRIKEKGFTQGTFAKEIKLNECTFSQKLNGKAEFRQEEMLRICEILCINIAAIPEYFFAH